MEVPRQRVQDLAEHAAPHPPLEAAMTRRRGRVPIGHVLPRRTRAQNPKNAVEHLAIVSPGTTSSVGSTVRLGDQRFDNAPLFVLEIHRSLRDVFHDAVEEQVTPSQAL